MVIDINSPLLRILYLEDDRNDVELVQAKLEEEGFACSTTHVETKDDFVTNLDRGIFDIILADYRLPSFDGLSALAIAREKTPDLPFIFVSGTMGEELAIETLKSGATDYVIKQRLSRLGPAVRRALKESGEHLERKKAEEELGKYRSHLEDLVEARTTELRKTNEELESEIAERMRNEKIMRVRLHLLNLATSNSMDGFLTAALDEIEALTGSSIGFYHFLDSDQETLLLQNWSTNTLKNTCTASGKGRHYDIAEAGVWVDCLSERRPVIHNDYASLPHRKGMPVGHTPVFREIVVPIIRGNQIKAIVGLGNKSANYNESDMDIVSQLGDLSWDIVERKRLEEALLASEARYRGIVEDQTELICRWLPDKTLTFVNEAYCRYFGKNQEEFIGRSFVSLIPEHHLEEIKKNIATLNWENPVQTHEHSVILPTGEKRWQEWTNRALFDDERRIVEFQSVGRDVTERKKAEEDLKHLADELKRSNRDLQQFAYLAAHDLQAPLHVADGYMRLLERRYKDSLDKNVNEFISGAIDSLKDMSTLIRDLLTYSRVGSIDIHPELVECSSILDKAISSLQTSVEESGAVITYDELPTLMADPSQLNRLFQNLLENAIKYRGDETPAIHVSAARTGNKWILSVKDNGIGMEPVQTEKIFEMFQRLHGKGKYPGTGIGLAICKRIVERQGGRIWVESEPGKGSIFCFTIPDRR